ncbi:hypothetical protein BU251_08290 [Candidatus Velamenicoccus archaeovorus]|uniref:Uncharacterized protein n=1 Tax=Velamenicoccus archaeovorus TaxID=1930593 RepID=A0A410P6M0_VELA1|nr:hypothetical protein [Candidatus Velamenicoccus archaeovorus]QAT17718.1 hypothetical protein BU251_08290 [Candidatus Velamenicoccus archaeovorus]
MLIKKPRFQFNIIGFFLAAVVVLGASITAWAEVVILKNGTVMRGKIVEKTPKYIVLRSGEGEAATRATIFLEDINRMTSEEEFDQERGYVPLSLFEADRTVVPVVEKEPLFSSVSSDASKEHIMAMVASEEEGSATPEAAAGGWASGELEPGSGQGAFLKRFIERQPHPLKPPRQETPGEGNPVKREGEGRISGVVTLPPLKGVSGDLYVYLLEDTGDGNYISASKMMFDKIDAAEIKGQKVPYSIEGVPAGTYKVFAQWDVARPAVKITTIGEKVSLAYLGAQGDYSGTTKNALTLGINELRDGVNFPCTTFIESDKMSFDWGAKPLFRIEDIYYQRNYPDENRFFLVIRNPTPQQIDILPLDIYINDKKIFSFPWEFRDIPANGEKEFDISQAYQGYVRLMGNDAGTSLKFTVYFANSKEKEFEKLIYVFK